jgi:hypothetical protein
MLWLSPACYPWPTEAPPSPPERDQIAAAEAACAAGEAEACGAVGTLRMGEGDYDAAEITWARACDGGHAVSCRELASLQANPMLHRGRETEAPERARQACDLGDGAGCFLAGQWLEEGANGLTPDPEGAVLLFAQGCELGHRRACREVE